jgi:proteasome assembly chaperone (PAC2) family protein
MGCACGTADCRRRMLADFVMDPDLKDPWLIAAWPGMGGVAQIAGNYLTQKLGARPAVPFAPGDHFDVRAIRVQAGIVQPVQTTAGMFYAWKNPHGGRDLVVFLADEQPPHAAWKYCEAMLDVARRLGVKRVFTFAAMGTMIHPKDPPRVFAVATRPELLEEMKQHEALALEEGEISGLNGLFLAAAAAQRIEGACLLGEFPYFAAGVANPKASLAALRVFSSVSGVEIDLSELEAHVPLVEKGLSEAFEKMQAAARTRAEADAGRSREFEEGEAWKKGSSEDLDAEAKARIEKLFENAKRDRHTAMELKAELDRLGVFKRYEDRFLDLFKQGG